jgi:hypothetical protein
METIHWTETKTGVPRIGLGQNMSKHVKTCQKALKLGFAECPKPTMYIPNMLKLRVITKFQIPEKDHRNLWLPRVFMKPQVIDPLRTRNPVDGEVWNTCRQL